MKQIRGNVLLFNRCMYCMGIYLQILLDHLLQPSLVERLNTEQLIAIPARIAATISLAIYRPLDQLNVPTMLSLRNPLIPFFLDLLSADDSGRQGDAREFLVCLSELLWRGLGTVDVQQLVLRLLGMVQNPHHRLRDVAQERGSKGPLAPVEERGGLRFLVGADEADLETYTTAPSVTTSTTCTLQEEATNPNPETRRSKSHSR